MVDLIDKQPPGHRKTGVSPIKRDNLKGIAPELPGRIKKPVAICVALLPIYRAFSPMSFPKKTLSLLSAFCLITVAAPALAGSPAQFNGQSLDQLSRAHAVEDVAAELAMVTQFSDEPSLKAAWVLHSGGIVVSTIAAWESACKPHAGPGNDMAVERRGALRGEIRNTAQGLALQLGRFCFVAYGPAERYATLMAQLAQHPTDQLLPRTYRPVSLEQGLRTLATWVMTPVNNGGLPAWRGLTAGKRQSSPEAAAAAAGFEDPKVVPRQSTQGTGYLLRCNSDSRVRGGAGLAVLDANQAVNQFAVVIAESAGSDVKALLTQTMGEAGREEWVSGLPTAIWYSGDFVARYEQTADKSWVFSWKNSRCVQQNC